MDCAPVLPELGKTFSLHIIQNLWAQLALLKNQTVSLISMSTITSLLSNQTLFWKETAIPIAMKPVLHVWSPSPSIQLGNSLKMRQIVAHAHVQSLAASLSFSSKICKPNSLFRLSPQHSARKISWFNGPRVNVPTSSSSLQISIKYKKYW